MKTIYVLSVLMLITPATSYASGLESEYRRPKLTLELLLKPRQSVCEKTGEMVSNRLSRSSACRHKPTKEEHQDTPTPTAEPTTPVTVPATPMAPMNNMPMGGGD